LSLQNYLHGFHKR